LRPLTLSLAWTRVGAGGKRKGGEEKSNPISLDIRPLAHEWRGRGKKEKKRREHFYHVSTENRAASAGEREKESTVRKIGYLGGAKKGKKKEGRGAFRLTQINDSIKVSQGKEEKERGSPADTTSLVAFLETWTRDKRRRREKKEPLGEDKNQRRSAREEKREGDALVISFSLFNTGSADRKKKEGGG